MREMKDSVIKWIGEIPVAWSVSRYKFFSQSRMGKTILGEDLAENGIPVYSATNDDDEKYNLSECVVLGDRLIIDTNSIIIRNNPVRLKKMSFNKVERNNNCQNSLLKD